MRIPGKTVDMFSKAITGLCGNRRGSAAIEFMVLMGVFIAVIIGVTTFGVDSVERSRDMRAIRVGADTAVTLAQEAELPAPADLDELIRVMRKAGEIGSGDDYAISVQVFERMGLAPARVRWQQQAGALGHAPLIRLEGDLVRVREDSFPVTADDILVGVELHRARTGLFRSGNSTSSEAVILFGSRDLMKIIP